MLYEYGKRTRDFFEAFLFFFKVKWGVFNKTIIPLALVGYEMVDSQLGAMRLVGYLLSHIQRTLVE